MALTVEGLVRPPMLAALSLVLAAGEVAAVVGPNGAGKTTLLRALAGLTRGPGLVTLAGKPLTPGRFSWLPAAREAPFPIRAEDIVALGLTQPDPAAVARALTRCDVAHLARLPLTRLSTGERARVLLARALAPGPPLLLLDEPTANLDPAHALLVARLLRQEADRGATVLFATHDLSLARARADRLIILERGRIAANGPPAAALAPALLARVFGVRDTERGFVAA